MSNHHLDRRDFLKLSGAAALAASTAGLVGGTSSSAQETRVVATTPSATPMQRADELLRQMTVEEKAMQLSAVYPMGLLGADGLIRSQLDAQLKHGIGHVSGLGTMGHKTPEAIAKTVNAIQRYLVTETRLGIPAIFHNEALNGVVAPHFTHFPTAIGLAATWDPAAVAEMADLFRRQMRSVGLLQALAPVMDVARDARWGRVHETYGEDPYLVSAMSVAFTRGMQGGDLREGVLATAKHFLGYAMTEGGQNMAATAVGPRELYDVYARPFEAAIRLAGLGSVMASYSEYEGVPIHVSYEVLTKLLRGRMGFTGTVVSDYVGVGWAQTRQRVAATPEEVGSLALAAGLDVELPIVHGYGQVPVHHGQKTGSGYRRTAADIHKGYLDMPSTPLFAFGHGLSYTTFDYSPLQLERDTIEVNGEARVSLTVTNTGSRRGTEVVQLYAADTATGMTLPAQQLIGFARLDLEPGASKTLTFVVPISLLGYTGLSGELVMEPGPVEVSAGSSSSAIRSSATFTVTGQTRAIRGEDRAFLSVATGGGRKAHVAS